MTRIFPSHPFFTVPLLVVIWLIASCQVYANNKIDPRLSALPLPLDCKLEKDCFFQNLPDLDTSPGVKDSFCGKASYDGHKGTDIRLISIMQAKSGINVFSILDGKVKAVRDGMADKLVMTKEDSKKIEGKECGNGVVIDHGQGLETQFCHMMRGSISVKPGQAVKPGSVLGKIGLSGKTQFPHIHISIRKNGREVDPNSGEYLDANRCKARDQASPMWEESIAKVLLAGQSRIIQTGVSGIVPKHNKMVLVGGPPLARKGEKNTIGWAWLINLNQGDTIKMTLYRDGKKLAENTSKPLAQAKASFSQYIGKQRPVQSGKYRLTTQVMRAGKPVVSNDQEFEIK